MLRQESVFGEIVIKKSTSFEQVMTEQAEVRDDWK
jgi:hypothetical protein